MKVKKSMSLAVGKGKKLQLFKITQIIQDQTIAGTNAATIGVFLPQN